VRIFSAEDVARLSPYQDIVEALRQGFRAPAETPVRHHHEPSPSTTLLLMPAWTSLWTGLKVVTVKTDNPALGLPTVQGSYLLLDNGTGAAVCMMDGTELTRRRTASASALAADYLARPDATVHAIIGAGALCAHFARAHKAVRPIGQVLIANRSPEKAEAMAQLLCSEGMRAEACDIESAVKQADIISGITSSHAPLIKAE
jgi:ornithine cyclodeaminase/alanine dehydrogenase-like protein (mu-crystallin family)